MIEKPLIIDTHWDPSKIITIAIDGAASMVGGCPIIILFISVTLLCGIDNIPHDILEYSYIHFENSQEYCQSHKTLLWIRIMLSLAYWASCWYDRIHDNNIGQ